MGRGGGGIKWEDITSEPQNRRMSNIECRRKEFCRFYKKTERSETTLRHSAVRYSTFYGSLLPGSSVRFFYLSLSGRGASATFYSLTLHLPPSTDSLLPPMPANTPKPPLPQSVVFRRLSQFVPRKWRSAPRHIR